MADESTSKRRKIPVVRPIEEDPIAWIADDARKAYVVTATYEPKFTIVEDRIGDQRKNWAPSVADGESRVYSSFGDYKFAMYEFVFEKLGVRMPFSEFAMAVFDHLHLAPSQLNPNSIGFIRAYELVCQYKEVVPSVPMFFRIFQIQRQSKNGRQGWVSLRSKIRLFDMFVGSVRGFKTKYYVVGA
ncbi:hypothetical protein L195_g052314, partial [Trifolium pratense]